MKGSSRQQGGLVREPAGGASRRHGGCRTRPGEAAV